MLSVAAVLFLASFGCGAGPSSVPPPGGAPPGPAPAACGFYVSPTGNDAGDGGSGAPWRTIQHALNRLQPGQTVCVRAGTYREFLTFQRSGSPGAPITLSGYPGETVVVEGVGLNWRYAIDLGAYDDIVVQNLTIRDFIRDGVRGFGVVGWGDTDRITLRNLAIALVATPVKFAADGSPEDRTDITIENITASQYGGSGIDLGPGRVSNVVVRNVQLTGPTGASDTAVDGIAVESGNQILIERATITGHMGDGVDLKADNVTVRQVDARNYGRNGLKFWGANGTLENSLFVGGQLEALVLIGRGPYNIRHNLFRIAPGRGYTATIGPYEPPAGTPATVVSLQGNIFYTTGNTGTLIYFSRVTQLTANYNLYFSPDRTDAVLVAFPGGTERSFSSSEINNGTWASAMATDQASRYADPLFLDPVGGNYELRSGSPGIDRVPSGQAPAVDLLGRARPRGQGADIGPYESG